MRAQALAREQKLGRAEGQLLRSSQLGPLVAPQVGQLEASQRRLLEALQRALF